MYGLGGALIQLSVTKKVQSVMKNTILRKKVKNSFLSDIIFCYLFRDFFK